MSSQFARNGLLARDLIGRYACDSRVPANRRNIYGATYAWNWTNATAKRIRAEKVNKHRPRRENDLCINVQCTCAHFFLEQTAVEQGARPEAPAACMPLFVCPDVYDYCFRGCALRRKTSEIAHLCLYAFGRVKCKNIAWTGRLINGLYLLCYACPPTCKIHCPVAATVGRVRPYKLFV